MERDRKNLKPGLEVRDVDGEHLGKVSRVHEDAMPVILDGQPVDEDAVETKTGLLGLGQRLYLLVSVVEGVMEDAVWLARQQSTVRPPGDRICPGGFLIVRP